MLVTQIKRICSKIDINNIDKLKKSNRILKRNIRYNFKGTLTPDVFCKVYRCCNKTNRRRKEERTVLERSKGRQKYGKSI